MWGILENHWNGTLLTCREAAIEWAKTMTWKGISPLVKILDKVFETGAKVTKKAFQVRSVGLGRDDLPLLAKVADLAHNWIFEQSVSTNGHANGNGKP